MTLRIPRLDLIIHSVILFILLVTVIQFEAWRWRDLVGGLIVGAEAAVWATVLIYREKNDES